MERITCGGCDTFTVASHGHLEQSARETGWATNNAGTWFCRTCYTVWIATHGDRIAPLTASEVTHAEMQRRVASARKKIRDDYSDEFTPPSLTPPPDDCWFCGDKGVSVEYPTVGDLTKDLPDMVLCHQWTCKKHGERLVHQACAAFRAVIRSFNDYGTN